MVTLLVTVGPDGTPQRTEVVRSSGHAALDDAARRAVLAWRFRPATRDGAPVPGQLQAGFQFNLR